MARVASAVKGTRACAIQRALGTTMSLPCPSFFISSPQNRGASYGAHLLGWGALVPAGALRTPDPPPPSTTNVIVSQLVAVSRAASSTARSDASLAARTALVQMSSADGNEDSSVVTN